MPELLGTISLATLWQTRGEDFDFMNSYFVFDVESVGLHGEGFAVGGGLFLENGSQQWGFQFACAPVLANGTASDLDWVNKNVPILEETHRIPELVRTAFWDKWIKAKAGGAVMAADCLWPVEANFISHCLDDNSSRKADGPYPFLEIASFLQAAGMDPIGTYDRTPSELPKHNPYCDAVQSARMLAVALSKIKA